MKPLALIVVVVVGCHAHGPALPTITGKGASARPIMHGNGVPACLEPKSEPFTVVTDVSPARAQRLIREMEHLRQVVLGVGFNSANAEGRSLVLALRDAEEVGVFIPPQFVA